MDINIIESKIRNILKENVDLKIPIEQINLEDNLLQIGMDSINCIKVILGIEEEFNYQFDDEDLNYENFHNISSLINYIKGNL